MASFQPDAIHGVSDDVCSCVYLLDGARLSILQDGVVLVVADDGSRRFT